MTKKSQEILLEILHPCKQTLNSFAVSRGLGLKGFTGWALCEICLEGSTTVVLGLGFRDLGFRGLGFRARVLVS